MKIITILILCFSMNFLWAQESLQPLPADIPELNGTPIEPHSQPSDQPTQSKAPLPSSAKSNPPPTPEKLSEPVHSTPPASSLSEDSQLQKKQAEPEQLPEHPSATAEEDILEHPTRSYEEYEKARSNQLFEQTIPYWSAGFNTSLFAFKDTDFRAGPPPGTPAEKPKLRGFLLNGERMILRHSGLLSIGIEGGVYTDPVSREYFDDLRFALITAGPYLQYQFNYFRKQFLVPIIRGGYEQVRYQYKFNGATVKGTRGIYRYDAGLLLNLNIFEPTAAGLMSSNYTIKRTYLSAVYSITKDPRIRDFDLDEKTFHLGVRIEL